MENKSSHGVLSMPVTGAHFTNLLRFLASRSSVATSDLIQRSITSLTAWSAQVWMSGLAMLSSRLSGLSMPSFGLGSNV